MQSAKTTQHTRNAFLATCLLGAAVASSASAEIEATGLLLGKLSGESAVDRAWSAATLYKDENNPVIEEFSLTGMLQLQTAWVNENGHSYDMGDIKHYSALNGAGAFTNTNRQNYWGDDVEVRRIRSGFKALLFHDIKIAAVFDMDPNFAYNRNVKGIGDTDLIPGFMRQIYTFSMTYAYDKQFNLSIGKNEVNSVREYELSSRELLTFERTMIGGMIKQPCLTGIWADGKEVFGSRFFYGAGLYSNESSKDFASMAAKNGAVYLAKIGYDYTELVEKYASKATTAFIWTHSTRPGQSLGSNTTNVTSKFANVYSWNTDIEAGPFGLIVEGVYCDGFKASDAAAFSIQPSYYIIPGRLQAVLRGQLATSTRKNGLTLYSRYEGATNLPAVEGYNPTGSEYSALYLGMNYYLNAHMAKFMAGIEYADMQGHKVGVPGEYSGVSYVLGFRSAF